VGALGRWTSTDLLLREQTSRKLPQDRKGRPSRCPPTMYDGSRGAAGPTCRRSDVSGRECKSAPVARTVRVNRYCNEINDGTKHGQKAPDLRYESVPKKSFRRDIRSIRNGCVHVRFGISALRHTLSIGRTGTTEMSGAG